ncbi:MAG: phosphoadenylyl-sulfate reductase [Deltaproteobacteria bacterium]|nr:phosphoadenylyl-sulfate reductase [Deltaproteobacteria bacterium]
MVRTPNLARGAPDAQLEDASAEELIAWSAERYSGRLVASTSFGAHSAVMLDLVARVAPETPIVFVDTGYLFPETYRFAEQLTRRLGLDVRVYAPRVTAARQEALYGQRWQQGEEGVSAYLAENKLEPMQRALKELGAEAWMAGLRSGQTAHRAALTRVGAQDGRVKIHPILSWTLDEVHVYLDAHGLPHHPLYAQGYRSIGDVHSTLPTTEDMDPRDGRILGKSRECGLHIPLTPEENESLGSSGL